MHRFCVSTPIKFIFYSELWHRYLSNNATNKEMIEIYDSDSGHQ